MYKLIASDLDGTLLRANKTISEYSKKVLKDNNDNFIFVPVTGKILGKTLEILKELEGMDYVVAINGSVIYDVKKEEIIYDVPLKREDCIKLFDLTDEYTDIFTLCTHNKWIKSYKVNKGRVEEHTFFVENMRGHIEVLDEEIYRINIYLLDEYEEKYLKMKEEIEKIGFHVYLIRSTDGRPGLISVTSKEVSKKRALDKVLELENVKWDETVVFGDNQNDKGMLMKAGYSVAMKNAPDHIKDITDDVTENTNDEDGVAKYIEEKLGEKLCIN
ncbi:MAG: Cof-type HAD-IIB family hydrolase [Clostridia bacterium]|jgi:Cof subfamily protein (haloacid dehalogenase superfamily)|nr:Cof-type HAD-IIB family hydrolase [Clostridia bacterium]